MRYSKKQATLLPEHLLPHYTAVTTLTLLPQHLLPHYTAVATLTHLPQHLLLVQLVAECLVDLVQDGVLQGAAYGHGLRGGRCVSWVGATGTGVSWVGAMGG